MAPVALHVVGRVEIDSEPGGDGVSARRVRVGDVDEDPQVDQPSGPARENLDEGEVAEASSAVGAAAHLTEEDVDHLERTAEDEDEGERTRRVHLVLEVVAPDVAVESHASSAPFGRLSREGKVVREEAISATNLVALTFRSPSGSERPRGERVGGDAIGRGGVSGAQRHDGGETESLGRAMTSSRVVLASSRLGISGLV